ncbi:MAG TPA: hypothetical protein VF774_11110 [Pseudoduganella sp.]|jgi:hypothetical protein
MNSSDFQKLKSGNFSFPMPHGDLVNITDSTAGKASICEAFKNFNKALLFLSRQYKYTNPLPELYADPLDMIIARARSDKIIVSRGLLLHLDAVRSEITISSAAEFRFSANTRRKLAGFWIIAHEFFHIARGHLKLYQKFYANYATAFEYDADCLASAALFRYVSHEIAPRAPLLTRKMISANAIFWCIRTLAGKTEVSASGRNTHPPIIHRLEYCITKLISLDIPHPNFGDSFELSVHSPTIWAYIVKLEENYIKNTQGNFHVPFRGTYALEKSELMRQLKAMCEKKIEDFVLEETWQEIMPYVEEVSAIAF